MRVLCAGLQSLAIEEPIPFEVPMRGSLSQLSSLTGLRSLTISLMAGKQVVCVFLSLRSRICLCSRLYL